MTSWVGKDMELELVESLLCINNLMLFHLNFTTQYEKYCYSHFTGKKPNSVKLSKLPEVI